MDVQQPSLAVACLSLVRKSMPCSVHAYNVRFQRLNAQKNKTSFHWNKERHFPYPCQILSFLPPAVSTIDVFKKRLRLFFIMRKVFVLISSEKIILRS